MDHIGILRRAWRILWSYRALWVFGIILALTTAGSGNGGNNGAQFSGDEGPDRDMIESLPRDVQEDFEELGAFFSDLSLEDLMPAMIAVGIGVACVLVLFFVVFRIARYVSEVALIRMVDDYEETGEKVGVRQGFRLGWSRSAWRLFLIDLVIDIPAFIGIMLLFLLAAAPVLISMGLRGGEPGLLAIVTTVGLAFLVIALVIISAVVLSLLKHFIRRACTLEESGVFDSIRRGYATMRQNLKDVGVMWLLMVGVTIGFAIVAIPAALLVLVLGVVAGGGLGLAGFSIARLLTGGVAPYIVAVAIGLPIFLLVLVVPLLFLGGLKEVFRSSTWTLTYRELGALAGLEPGEPTALDAAEADAT